MTNFINFKNYQKENVLNLYEMWNKEYGFIFHITEDLFKRNTYGTPGFLEENSFVAIEDNESVGFIISKVWDYPMYQESFQGIGWISLIFVKKEYRNRGIGSTLLDEATNGFKQLGITKLYLGKDYQNFFPGLPKDLKSKGAWFSKRGFEALYETNDLINLNPQGFTASLKEYHDNREYNIHLACEKDFPRMQKFFEKSFPGRWVVEFLDYVKYGGNGNEFLICTNSLQEVVGFCRLGTNETPIEQIGFSLTWRAKPSFVKLGGLGPLGVSKDYRHNNIAYNLLVSGLLELKKRGCHEVIIDWTNLLDFYRMFGFELWKTYIYTEKNI